jgi:hypothetical protein
MVLKEAPEVFGKHLSRNIGDPLDYIKNKESGNFPNSYDLRVPLGDSNLDEEDISGALDDMALSANTHKEETKTRRAYQPT